MKKLAFGALFGLVAACGGGSSTPDGHIVITDGGGADAPAACNVNAGTGCTTGQKCTWERVSATVDSQLGEIQCVPDGNVALGGNCTWGTAGEGTGFDNCAAGLYCLAPSDTDQATGTCLDTCSLDGSANGCATGYECARYADAFANGTGTPLTGLCEEGCDPLTQKTKTNTDVTAGNNTDTYCGGKAETDGTNTPCYPVDGEGVGTCHQSRQCVGVPAGPSEKTVFSCAAVLSPPNGNATNGDRHVLTATEQYLNSCGPRALPILGESTDMLTQPICASVCKPADTYMGSSAQYQGVSPYDLVTLLGTPPASEECHYWWSLEDTAAVMSEYSNGLGFAIDISQYHYDNDNNANTPDIGFPSCKDLAMTDTDNNGTADYLEWGCGAEPAAALAGQAPKPKQRVHLHAAFSQAQFDAVMANYRGIPQH